MNETDLRWSLRQLPREIEPARDLWPGIAEGIARRPAKPRRHWLSGLAMAASVALALGLAWRIAPGPGVGAAPDPTAKLLQREASAMTTEYHAALRQFDGAPVPETIEPGLKILDHSAEQIRRALAADPDSRVLLEQLRKTYSRRLELTQRAITG